MRILFVTSNRIGDAVLTTGLLDHLIRTWPAARITVACGPYAAGLFDRMPNRETTIVMEKQPWSRHWLGLWWRVAGTHWDCVVDVRGSGLAYTIRARRRALLRGGWRGGHRILQVAAVLRLSPPPSPVAWFAPEDAARAAALLPGPGLWVALGPTANWTGKVWPPERYAALFRELAAPGAPLAGARAAVFGGPGAAERALAAPLLAALPGAVDLVGSLTLPEAAAALARCALFAGNDSGLMHLAAATGTPTLGLFGPTPAEQYAPIGRHARAVLARGPAGTAPMTDLPVADALAAATDLLAAASDPQPALASAG